MTLSISARAEVERLLGRSLQIEWDEPSKALSTVNRVMDAIVERPDLIQDLVEGVSLDQGGAYACESYPQMDKVVLWQAPNDDSRLRLHLFSPGYFDRPHNHRWSFASRVLHGSYLHSLYGHEDDVRRSLSNGQPPGVQMATVVGQNQDYLLHHTAVHSLRVSQPTVSLVLRGPAVKSEYFTLALDDEERERRTQSFASRGIEGESETESAAKAMSPEGLTKFVSTLRNVGIL